MPPASGIRAGRAFVELFGDDSKLVRCLNQAEKKVKAFGKGIMSFGGKIMAGGMALTAPLIGALKTFTDWGSELKHMSERTGVSVQSLSELGYAARVSGTDMDTLEGGLRKMSKAITGADEESKGAQKTLSHLGLSLEQLAGLGPEKQFELIASKIAGISDPTLKAGTAMEIFGKSGTKLIPMLGNMSSLRAEAIRLGQTMSDADAQSAHELEVSLDTLWGTIRGVAVAIGVDLADSVKELTTVAAEWIARVAKWIRQHQDLVITFAKIAAGVVAVGAVIVGLGAIVYGVGMAFGILASIMGVILSPITLITAGIAGLVAGLIYATDSAGWFGDMFGWLKDTALTAWGAIGNAIASGDLGAAMDVAWSAIKMIWVLGTNFLWEKWIRFKGLYDEGVHGIALAFVNISASIQKIWATLLNWMSKTWKKFTTSTFEQKIAEQFAAAGVERLDKFGNEVPDYAKKVEEAKKAVSVDFENKRKDQKVEFEAMDAETEKKKQTIEQERKDRETALGQDLLENDKARQKEIDDLGEKAVAAKKEFDKSVGLANALPGARPGKKETKDLFIKKDTTGLSKSDTIGTFNKFALSSMGSSGNFVEQTAENTRRLQADIHWMRLNGMKILATG